MAATILQRYIPNFTLGAQQQALAIAPLQEVIVEFRVLDSSEVDSLLSTPETNLIYDVPDEIVLLICNHLAPKDVLQLAASCRRLHHLCTSDELWSKLLLASSTQWEFVEGDSTVLNHHSALFGALQTWLEASPSGPGTAIRTRARTARAAYEHAGGISPAKRIAHLLGATTASGGWLQWLPAAAGPIMPSFAFFGPGLQTDAGSALIGDMMWSPGSGFNMANSRQRRRRHTFLNNAGGLMLELQRQEEEGTDEKVARSRHQELPKIFNMVAMYGRERAALRQQHQPPPAGAWARSITATAQGRDMLAAVDGLAFIVDAGELADCVAAANDALEPDAADTAAALLADVREELTEFLAHAKPGAPLLVLACSAYPKINMDGGGAPMAAPPTAAPPVAEDAAHEDSRDHDEDEGNNRVSAKTARLAGGGASTAREAAALPTAASAVEIARMLLLGPMSRAWRVETLAACSRPAMNGIGGGSRPVTRLPLSKDVSVPLKRGVGWLLDAQVIAAAESYASSSAWPW